jgi:hypothetical protein
MAHKPDDPQAVANPDHYGILILITASLFISSCASIPATPVEVTQIPSPGALQTSTPLEIKPTKETPASLTPAPSETFQLPETDQIVFTIPNTEPWSGREGDARPDWMGWGAETFTVAPDGTFWIADTAVYPNRLLQYNPQGELLKEIALQDIVVYAYNVLVTQEGIWVLDISAEQPKVVKLSLDGELLSGVDITKAIMTTDGSFLTNGAFRLFPGEEGELLLASINGYYELLDAFGEIGAQPMDALTYYGHTYQVGTYDQTTGKLPISVDGVPLEISPDFIIETPFLGFNPDGSFVLAGYMEAADNPADWQVRYYGAAGNILGTARQRPQTFYKDWNHHLAFGPDGSVYQLLSNPDHSVQIVRLGFAESLPPRPETLLATPTPLTPLSPSESSATDEEQARNVLLAFFANLSTGNYAQAAAHFGGEVSEYARAPMPGETIDAYWEYVCGFLWCLPVAEITGVEQVSENEYLFYVVFMQQDGTRFEIGACCGGDPAATPPMWQFAYPVEKIDGVWKVVRGPLFTP